MDGSIPAARHARRKSVSGSAAVVMECEVVMEVVVVVAPSSLGLTMLASAMQPLS